MITLIAEDGSDLRTSRVPLSNAQTHIQAGDNLADEARCLLAWRDDESERDPIGWNGESLIFDGDIGDAEPVQVIYK